MVCSDVWIEEALNTHISAAPNYMQKVSQVVDGRASGSSVSRAVKERLNSVGERLRGRLAEFRGGWTAPVAKPWKDRRPLLYAILLLLIGAIVGQVVPDLRKLFQLFD